VILVDTSAWVEFDRGTDSPADLRLQHLIASGADIAVSEPILMEVLAGARNDVERVRLRPSLMISGVVAVTYCPCSSWINKFMAYLLL